jgi:hypothetical protein
VIMVMMIEGEVYATFYIDRKEGLKMAEYVEEYNRFSEDWYDDHLDDEYDECPSILEWLDRCKNVTTAPVDVAVISGVDGYWYT